MPLWRTFFDGLFFFSSALLAIFFGAALGNVVRGVPIGPDDYFFLPLWTNWRTGANPGILDWYTVLGGVLALAALSLHGALYLALKTEVILSAVRSTSRAASGSLPLRSPPSASPPPSSRGPPRSITTRAIPSPFLSHSPSSRAWP